MKKLKDLFSKGKSSQNTSQTVYKTKQDIHQPVHKDKTMSGTVYQCPMKCEGDRTYNTPGNCPVCNMKLVAVDSGKDSHGHSHGCC
ncbi:heavy metal-binding domain-containing protein [Sunxiuqinia dokdonensis]|uniref:heavy metal-binding domain-containing protein n=1 Tax=Sunxiuqinia dokdonensis TaxID=1409788 RepID=UPI0012FB6643|nr:heavy metal-binding domain-containing protein [Sunxiuqinia dokdonensis]